MKLTNCSIMTNDLVKMVKFYMSVIPAAIQDQDFDESDRYIELKMENVTISIVSIKQDSQGLFMPNTNKSILLEFLVDDVDAEYERLKNLGVEIVIPLETTLWGHRSFYFKDPDGNNISFYTV